MNISIRKFKPSDYLEIVSWWKEHKEQHPLPGMMIEDGTFILELDDEPVLTLTAYRTQSPEISFLEGFCAKPGLKKEQRNKLSRILFSWCINYLREHKVKRTIIYAIHAAVAARYEELGMTLIKDRMYALGREI